MPVRAHADRANFDKKRSRRPSETYFCALRAANIQKLRSGAPPGSILGAFRRLLDPLGRLLGALGRLLGASWSSALDVSPFKLSHADCGVFGEFWGTSGLS